MFRIDLLNGSEGPPRSHPLRVAAVALAFIAVAAGGVFDGARYLDLRNATAAQRRSLQYYDRELAGLADTDQSLKVAERYRTKVDATLAEVGKILALHTKWSDILGSVATIAPESVTITHLMAKREEIKRAQTPTYDYSVMMGVISPEGSVPVQAFIGALRREMPLKPGSDSVRIIAQQREQIRGREFPYYLIECQLEP